VTATVPGGDRSDHGLTHLDASGRARMVDVTGKPRTHRIAVARAAVVTTVDLAEVLVGRGGLQDIVEAARLAGITAAKQTSKLIPLCHPVQVNAVTIEVRLLDRRCEVQATAEIVERTGVEMEALTACAVSALTLISVLHDHDLEASVEELTLWHKSGGRSGDWDRADPDDPATTVAPLPARSDDSGRRQHA
jgi:cyclic pyranopterin monophosphate synthase